MKRLPIKDTSENPASIHPSNLQKKKEKRYQPLVAEGNNRKKERKEGKGKKRKGEKTTRERLTLQSTLKRTTTRSTDETEAGACNDLIAPQKKAMNKKETLISKKS